MAALKKGEGVLWVTPDFFENNPNVRNKILGDWTY